MIEGRAGDGGFPRTVRLRLGIEITLTPEERSALMSMGEQAVVLAAKYPEGAPIAEYPGYALAKAEYERRHVRLMALIMARLQLPGDTVAHLLAHQEQIVLTPGPKPPTA